MIKFSDSIVTLIWLQLINCCTTSPNSHACEPNLHFSTSKIPTKEEPNTDRCNCKILVSKYYLLQIFYLSKNTYLTGLYYRARIHTQYKYFYFSLV